MTPAEYHSWIMRNDPCLPASNNREQNRIKEFEAKNPIPATAWMLIVMYGGGTLFAAGLLAWQLLS